MNKNKLMEREEIRRLTADALKDAKHLRTLQWYGYWMWLLKDKNISTEQIISMWVVMNANNSFRYNSISALRQLSIAIYDVRSDKIWE